MQKAACAKIKSARSFPILLSCIAAAVILVAIASFIPGYKSLRCRWYLMGANPRHDIVMAIDDKQLNIEISDDDAEREVGLSGRKCMPQNSGMLFVFDQPGTYSFWMKDMQFPLDIIWLDADKNIVSVQGDIRPNTYLATFTSNSPAQYVLELNADSAERLGLKTDRQLAW